MADVSYVAIITYEGPGVVVKGHFGHALVEDSKRECYYAAQFPDLPGLTSKHDSLEGLLENLPDALGAYCRALQRDSPLPPAETSELQARKEGLPYRVKVTLEL